ncbi:amphi-Trp domain-containing protein [Monaibacterium marinum]|uniref:Amphi-Trp domain-containing protein n=2 Tax=Pontivivens marinum TaxID=1690039 RepID=A0A2C9CLK1_9RHOB|nr:amphi-Trp domain-containing protein [Monaibacterium marinum]
MTKVTKMADDTSRFTHESLEDAKTIKTLLTALSKGFSKGQMTLGDGDKELVLDTGGLMTVRIKAQREDGQNQFNLRVSWTDPAQPAPSKGTPQITS